jgi:hypothetical protein
MLHLFNYDTYIHQHIPQDQMYLGPHNYMKITNVVFWPSTQSYHHKGL